MEPSLVESIEDRRCGEDRRSLPRSDGAERRRGRPPLPPDQRKPKEERPRTLHVKVTAAMHDAICRIALRRGIAVNAVLRALIKHAARTPDT